MLSLRVVRPLQHPTRTDHDSSDYPVFHHQQQRPLCWVERDIYPEFNAPSSYQTPLKR